MRVTVWQVLAQPLGDVHLLEPVGLPQAAQHGPLLGGEVMALVPEGAQQASLQAVVRPGHYIARGVEDGKNLDIKRAQ